MKVLPFIRPQTARPVELGELFYEARQYGLVRLSTWTDGRYIARIEFASIDHTTLEADSGFVDTPENALRIAITAAKEVVATFRGGNNGEL